MANGVSVTEDKKCFDCFTRSLTSPFVGPCGYGHNCKMPTCPTEACQECDRRVHRLCVPQQSDSVLFCPSCFEAQEEAPSIPDAPPEPASINNAAASNQQDEQDNTTDGPTASSDDPSAAEAESPDGEASAPKPRNKGGRPKGSTKAAGINNDLRRKQAVNYVCIEYAEAKEEAKREGKKRVEDGLRKKLCKEAKAKFELDGEFNVPESTIRSRMKADNLTVFNTGQSSPVLEMEPFLVAIIMSSWECNVPLTVGECILIANNLIEGTQFEQDVIAFKVKRRIYDPDGPLLGNKWWQLFRQRNILVVESKVGRKFATLRAQHCTYYSLEKMYNTFESALVTSGNAIKLDTPVLMNRAGEVVEDEAEAFGHAVTIRHTRPHNVLVTDETGSNTREMGDGNNGGQKCMAPCGETPRYEASSKDSHFTVVPLTRLTGELATVAIIFAGNKMKPEWAMGKDIMADWEGADDDLLSNIGPGKYFPMGPTCIVNGKTVRCYCDCSPNGSMTSAILRRILHYIDKQGIVERGVDEETGQSYHPVLILDGHISRMGLPFLKYVNTAVTKWSVPLVCPYGTHKTQFHDDEKQNGSFKCALFEAKRTRILARREAGLPAELTPEEIPIIVKTASDKSYANRDFAVRTLIDLGYSPFTRAVLDDPEILRTASPAVQEERGRIIKLRQERQGTTQSSTFVRPAPNQVDLNAVGSGLLAGGVNPETASVLNTTNGRAGSVFNLLQRAKTTQEARRANTEAVIEADTREKKLERFKKTRNFTAGVAFFSGNGMLDEDVLAEVERRYEKRQQNEAKTAKKKKKALRELQARIKAIKAIIRSKKKFKPTDLKVPQLKDFCRWKKQPGDKPLPTKKADLIARFNKTKGNASPNVSPWSSEAEEEAGEDVGDDDDVDSLDTDASAPECDDLEFGSDSEDESEDGSGSEEEDGEGSVDDDGSSSDEEE